MTRRLLPAIWTVATLGLSSGLAQAAEAGATVDQGLAVHLPQAGLDAVGEAVARVVPQALSVEASGGELACADDDAAPLTWALDALDLLISIDRVALTPADGTLDLALYGTLDSTDSTLDATGDCSVFTDLEEACGVRLPTTALEAHMALSLSLDGDAITVAAADPTLSLSPIGNPLSDCTLASAVGSVLGQDPLFVSDLLAGLVEPQLAGLGESIEAAAGDALTAASLASSLDLLGVQADLTLAPTLVEISDRGVVVGLGGGVVPGALSTCVDAADGAPLTEAGWPVFGATAAGSSLPHHAGIWLGADFLDQALYNLWAAGLLCVDVDALLADAGLAIDAGLLDSLLGGGFTDLFGDDAPVSLVLVPGTPPTAVLDDDVPPLAIDPGHLQLELWTVLDSREVRVFAADVEVRPGIDLALDGDTLRVELLLEPDDIRLVESYYEHIDPGFSGGLTGLFDTLVPSLLPDNPLLSIQVPAPLGMQVGPLTWLVSDDGAWLGGFLLLDPTTVTPLAVPGCSLDGVGCDGGGVDVELDLDTLLGCGDAGLGCDGASGCDGGAACAATGARHRAARAGRGRLLVLLALMLGVVGRRFSRRDVDRGERSS